MEKRIKQFVSAAGIAGVALITGATTISLPNVNAESGVSGSVDVTLQVVNDNNPGSGPGGGVPGESKPIASIINIGENSTVTSSSLDVKIGYENANFIKYTLTHIDAGNKKHVYELDTYQTPSSNGTHEWALNLAQYGYGTFILSASVNGDKVATDTVKFRYNEVHITDTAQTNNAGNPIITTEFGEATVKICYEVYYTGKSLTGNGSLVMGGKNDPICHNPTMARGLTNSTDFVLPFNDPKYKKDIKAGNYRVVVKSYSASGVLLGIDEGRLSNFFIPNTGDLDVPDTGSFMATLNLSRADYVLSGLVIFGFATIFALWFINRSGRARSYKRR